MDVRAPEESFCPHDPASLVWACDWPSPGFPWIQSVQGFLASIHGVREIRGFGWEAAKAARLPRRAPRDFQAAQGFMPSLGMVLSP